MQRSGDNQNGPQTGSLTPLRRTLSLTIGIVLIVIACGSPSADVDTDGADGAGTGRIQPAVAVASEVEIFVSYIEGIADVRSIDSEWRPLDVGMSLEPQDSVRTAAAAYATIEIGDIATIRLQENTQIDLSRVELTSVDKRALVRVSSGSLASKVGQLTGGSSYAVGTATAVAGVRGTEFLVSMQPDGSTRIAVRSGRVAVVPGAPDQQEIAEAIGTARAIELPQEALNTWLSILQSAPEIGPGQEIAVSVADAASVSDSLSILQTSITVLTQDPDSSSPQSVSSARTLAVSAGLLDRQLQRPAATIQPASPAALQLLDQAFETTTQPAPRQEPQPAEPEPTGSDAAEPVPAMQDEARPAEPPVGSAAVAPPVPASVPAPEPEPEAEAVEPRTPVAARRDAITARFPTAGASLVRALEIAADRIVVADQQGTVWAFGADGRSLWKVPTTNTNNENSRPVVSGGTVVFSGERELVGINLNTGQILYRRDLDEIESHLFGNRVLIEGASTYIPTRTGIVVVDTNSGAQTGRFPVPGEILTSPALWEGTILVATTSGDVFALDRRSGEVVWRTSTSLLQPVAIAAAIHGRTAFLVDRRGVVVALNVESGTQLFDRSMDPNERAIVVTDPVVGARGLYLLARGTIYGIDANSGEPLFDPRHEASTPPALIADRLYYGTNANELAEIDPLTGQTLARLPLPHRATTRPAALSDGRIAVGLGSGDIVLIDRTATDSWIVTAEE